MAVAAACLVGFSACGDFLDADNRSKLGNKAYFSTTEGYNALLNNAYEHLRDVYEPGLYTKMFNAGTDMYCGGHTTMSSLPLNIYETLTPDDGDVKNFYTYCYQGIRAALAVKYYAAGAQVTDAVRNQYTDEARVIACYYYYLMVNTFGGVPLMKDYVEQASTGYPKATAEQVYTYIIEELENVVSNNYLKASTATQGGGRASMEAAKAVLAKTYLSAAWDLNKAEYFGKAAKYADEVINNRKLTTPFADLWKADYSGDDNEEFIWDVEYDLATAQNTTTGGTNWGAYYCNYLGGGEDPIKYTASQYVPTIYAWHNFEKGDLRYDVTFMKEMPDIAKGNAAGTGYYTWYTNGESLAGYPVLRYYSAWYETDADFKAWQAKDPENRKNTYRIPMDTNTKEAQNMSGEDKNYYVNLTLVHSSSPCKKFDDCKTASNQASTNYRDIHMITLPEMFLVAAEAYMKAGNTQLALARINEVHQRAGLPALTSIDIETILKESACECFGNNMRFFDLRRTGKLIEHCNLYNPDLEGNAANAIGQKLLRPIPQSAIDANDRLSEEDQNPGY